MSSSSDQPATRFPVPAETRRVEETIKRSRFITTVARAGTPDAARAIIARVRAEFPDATHHCWAYVAGAPGSSRAIGMSDDGEPHGTAGKPMLNVLMHGGVGEIVAVCTRYYGGVKLGTGGLSRAYASGVANAIGCLPTTVKQEYVPLLVEVPYENAEAIQRLANDLKVIVENVTYGANVQLDVLVPFEVQSAFSSGVREVTRGRVSPTPRSGDAG